MGGHQTGNWPKEQSVTMLQTHWGSSLAVQWLALHALTAKDLSSIPGELRSHKPHSMSTTTNNNKNWLKVWVTSSLSLFVCPEPDSLTETFWRASLAGLASKRSQVDRASVPQVWVCDGRCSAHGHSSASIRTHVDHDFQGSEAAVTPTGERNPQRVQKSWPPSSEQGCAGRWWGRCLLCHTPQSLSCIRPSHHVMLSIPAESWKAEPSPPFFHFLHPTSFGKLQLFYFQSRLHKQEISIDIFSPGAEASGIQRVVGRGSPPL